MSRSIPSRRALSTASNSLWPATPAASNTAAATYAISLTRRPSIQQKHSCAHTLPLAAVHHLHTSAPQPLDWRGLFRRNKKTRDAASAADKPVISNDEVRQKLRERMTDTGLGESPLLAAEMGETGGVDVATKDAKGQTTGAASHATRTNRTSFGTSLVPSELQRAVDPDPRSRVRWERKMVERHVARMLDPAGHETKAERLARTERELHHRSSLLPTSTKKLMYLARQIAGKTLEDALVQMRFSKKKSAREVIWLLEEARDMAVVERGMGLSKVTAAAATPGAANTSATSASSSVSEPVRIRTKDGKWLTITDPSRIYIDQAWVGKGQWRAKYLEYRARGRTNVIKSPTAILSVVLKEEKTRIRLHNERAEKDARKTPWVHLPNRPVTAQRPYYSW